MNQLPKIEKKPCLPGAIETGHAKENENRKRRSKRALPSALEPNWNIAVLLLCLLCACLASATTAAHAEWSDRFNVPGTTGPVYAVAKDPSGNVYIGGNFTGVGDVPANYVAKWDGTNWSALGTGASSTVYAIAFDKDGNLYAGGRSIAKWDGTSWSYIEDEIAGSVYALAVDNEDNLYAGGNFSNVGGVAVNDIAKWDGSAWSSMSGGVDNGSYSCRVEALDLDNSGNLYVGGYFKTAGGAIVNNVAGWNGFSWFALGAGITSQYTSVYALSVDSSSQLYAGGTFSQAGGVYTSHIAKWDGNAWSNLGEGVDDTVRALSYDAEAGTLYAGGIFSSGVAKWDGSSWSSLGTGIDNYALALEMDDAKNLYVGGNFGTAGGFPANHVARWNGASWSALASPNCGMSGVVEAMAFDTEGVLYASGSFITAGGVSANRLAKWDGQSWQGLDGGTNHPAYCLAIDKMNNLFIGGAFDLVGGVSANRIARWDGETWTPLVNGIENTVLAIAIGNDDKLYAGGMFVKASGLTVNRVAEWNGSSWQALGNGVSNQVEALSVDRDGKLYVGGWFDTAGDITVNKIAKWDGVSWSALGNGIEEGYGIIALACDGQGSLYAGGLFTVIGGVSASGIAKWNGVSWEALGTGVDGWVHSLSCDDMGNLYAGGSFRSAGGLTVNGVARWNGEFWSAIGNGVDRIVESVLPDSEGNLFVGGEFGVAGGVVSSNIAYWDSSTPKIDIRSNGISIEELDMEPSAEKNTDFGEVFIGEAVEHTFSIHNLGEADFELTTTDVIPECFTFAIQPSTLISPGDSSSFVLRFEPDAIGEVMGSVLFLQINDIDSYDFIIIIRGVGVANLPSVPYQQDFSAGLPSSCEWQFYSSEENGQIQVVGGRLRMDASDSSTYNLNEAILSLDLLGLEDIELSFFQTDISDETHSIPLVFTGHEDGDGVSISSDGVSWYRILDASDLDGSSVQASVDLDSHISRIRADYDPAFGYTSDFKIKFQQYDNGAVSVDGREWDDISVTVQAVPLALFLELPENAAEGDGVLGGQGTVSLANAVESDLTVGLQSDDVTEAAVPATVVISSGNLSADFDLTVIDDTEIDGSQTATITASATGCEDAIETLTIQDNETTTLTVSVQESATEGDGELADAGLVSIPGTLPSDLEIDISSDDTTEVLAPATVTIFSGNTSASFSLEIVEDGDIDDTQTVTITASAVDWTSGEDSIQIFDNEAKSLVVAIPDNATEGDGTLAGAGLVSISGTVGENLVVNLLSADTTVATVPATVTIQSGQDSASFSISIIDDEVFDGPQTATVTASASGWTSGSDTIQVSDNETKALTVTIPESATEGAGALSGTVSIPGTLEENLVVGLSSDDSTEATVPASVTIQAGQTSAVFNVSVVDDSEIDGPKTATVTASVEGWISGSDTIQVSDNETKTLTVTVPENATEGDGALSGAGTVSIPGTLEENLVVGLSSGDSTEATLPASVTIQAGQTSAVFNVSVVDDKEIDGPKTATVTASVEGWISGSDTIQVSDNETKTLTVTIPESAIEGAGALSGAGTVSIPGTLGENLVVGLSSGDATEAAVPASVTIQAGQTSAVFNVSIIDDNEIDGSKTATVTASVEGWISGIDTIQVSDNETKTLTVTIPESAIEGAGALSGAGTVSIPGTLGENFVVGLSSGDTTEAAVPASVTIQAGQTSAVFNVSIIDDNEIDGPKTATITASASGWASGIDTIQVSDNETKTLTVTIPESATEGDGALSGAGTVSLPGTLTENLVVSLLSGDSTEATVPASVTIQAGQTSAVFNVSIVDDNEIDGPKPATVTASVASWTSGSDTIQVEDNETKTLTVNVPENATEGDGALSGAGTASIPGTLTENLVVGLSSGDSTEATVPASVTILAGQTSAAFNVSIVDDSEIDGPKTATVTATVAGWTSGSDTIQVADNETKTLTVTVPENAAEGDGTLSGAGTASIPGTLTENLVVGLSSGDSTEATVPASVTILEGQTSAVFNVSIVDDNEIDGPKPATVTASASGWTSGSDTIQVADNETKTLTVTVPENATEGDGALSGAGTVSIPGTLTENLVVGLSSGDSTEATVPASVTILAGQTSAAFNVSIIDDNEIDGPKPATVTVSVAGWTSGSDTIQVADNETKTLTVTISESATEGAGTLLGAGTVSIPGTLTENLVVGLSSGDATEATVPASVTIEAGQTSAVFNVSVVDDSEIDGSKTATITASASGWASGIDTIQVSDNETKTLTVTIPESAIEGAGALSGAGTVSIPGTLSENLVVGLSSGDSTEVTVPASVTIQAGQVSAVFNVSIIDDSEIDGSKTVTVTASVGGWISGSDTIQVSDNETKTLTVNVPENAAEGDGALSGAGTVSIPGTLTENLVVGLSSGDSTEAAVPASVTIQAGQTSAVFNVSIVDDSEIDGPKPATVTASVAGWTSGSDTIQVADNETKTLTVNVPENATEGDGALSGAGTASIPGTLTENLVVGLLSGDSTEATVPASVTIQAGQTSAVFNVSIVDDSEIDGSKPATVTASVAGWTSGSDTIQVADNETKTLTVNVPENATEGDGALSGAGTASIPGTLNENLVVGLSSGDSTEATVPASVTIQAGQTSAVFNVSIVDDNEIDGPQTATVTATVSGWTSGSDTIQVADNETKTLTLTIPESATEGDGALSDAGTASISGTIGESLTVTLASDDPSEATVPETVTIPSGETSVSFDLTVVDDAAIDGPRTVTITAVVDGWTQAEDTVEVLDNEPLPSVQFERESSEGDESATSVELAVVLSSESELTATVDYAVSGGSADGGGVDFELAAGRLTFEPWETSKHISFAVIDDDIDEDHEFFTVVLSGPFNATLGDTDRHYYLILDNDRTSETVTVCQSGCDFSSIQAAIDAVLDEDTVSVGPGAYRENIDFKGKAITVRATHGANRTVIDGGCAASAVRFATGETRASVLRGFSVENGCAEFGGGIFMNAASPTVQDCTIIDNRADFGGGMYMVNGSNPAISNSVVRGNQAENGGAGVAFFSGSDADIAGGSVQGNVSETDGGGLYLMDSSPVLDCVEIAGNSAMQNGGGLCATGSSAPSLDRCSIRENSARNRGGGSYATDTAAPEFVNTLVVGNAARYEGGGFCALGSPSTMRITNATVVGNAADFGGGLYAQDASVAVGNSIFRGNGREIDAFDSAVAVSFSNVESGEGLFPGDGNIDADPLFAVAGVDYHLKDGSLCIDKASPDLAPSRDIDGEQRPCGGAPDMGADEWNDSVPYACFTATPTSGYAPVTVSFADCSVSKEGIAFWSWDFGDGSTSADKDPSHEYAEEGVYTVTLTVSEADGDSSAKTRWGVVEAKGDEPSADFSATPTSGRAPLAVSFTDLTVSPDTVQSRFWDFGDGSTSTESDPDHEYSAAGTYTVRLTVTDIDGDSDSKTCMDCVEAVDTTPKAAFSGFPTIGNAPLTVSFYDGSSSYSPVSSWLWSFGDGETSSERDPIHQYQRQGSYTVSLTVTAEDGQNTVTRTGYVRVVATATCTIDVCQGGACPHETIQSAIDASLDGDTVVVQPGEYVENIDFKGKAVTVVSRDGKEETAIDGGCAGSVAVFANGEGAGSVLDGFTLRNGCAVYGGGIRCEGSSPTIRNCDIVENDATAGGGGIAALHSSDPVLRSCRIEENTAGHGGGVGCYFSSSPRIAETAVVGNHSRDNGGGICAYQSSSPVVESSAVEGNTAANRGGGMYADSCTMQIRTSVFSGNEAIDGAGLAFQDVFSPYLSRCRFIENVASGNGGAAFVRQTSLAEFRNCLLAGNSAGNGGAWYFESAVSPIVVNCTAAQNVATNGAAGIYGSDVAQGPVVTNTILFNDGDEIALVNSDGGIVRHCDVELPSGTYNGTGNISASPLFVAPGSDYHLASGSPCRNAGTSDGAPEVDLDGKSRPKGAGLDMGCYEEENMAPEIEQASPVEASMDEDGQPTPWSAPALSAVDGDLDVLQWSVLSPATHGTAVVGGTGASPTVFSFEPEPHFHGKDSFVAQVSDEQGETDSVVVEVTVASVNDPPTIQGVPDTSAPPGSAYEFFPSAEDVDSEDTLSFEIENKPGWTDFDEATGALTGTPSENDIGTTSGIVITAVDSFGATASLPPFDLTVEDLPASPVPTTGEADSVSSTCAELTGTIQTKGADTLWYFEFWSDLEDRQITEPLVAAAERSARSASLQICGLLPRMKYRFRLIAENSLGLVFGEVVEFVTSE